LKQFPARKTAFSSFFWQKNNGNALILLSSS